MHGRMDEKLTHAKTRLRRRQKLESMLGEARRTLLDEQTKQSHLKRKLEDEQADVDRLEGFSLSGIFYTMLGTKEDRLDQERQEVLSAKLRYDETVEAIAHAQGEVERLQVELSAFQGAQEDYDRLIAEKERLLRQAADERMTTLLDFAEQLADLQSEQTELNEALQAGNEALVALESVRDELRSAQNWGTWDMLGGGLLSTMAKHSHIDSARERAHRAQQRLHRFREELADADQRLQVSLDDIGGFSTFADYFFDGLIADWVVQSKIENASSACSIAIQGVRRAMAACGDRLEAIEQEVDQVGRQKREFIEQA